VIAGVVLLLQKIANPFPWWLFTWPVALMAFGAFIGVRKHFRGPGWLIMILIGAAFLFNMLNPGLNLERYMVPIFLIVAGAAFVLRPRRNEMGEKWGSWRDCNLNDEKKNPRGFSPLGNDPGEQGSSGSGPDELDVVSILGGTKKIIFSKNFKGGEATSFFGGTELNLSQADIHGRVVLDLTQVFGGTKLIVPSNWDIQPELVSIFGGIEDKRQLTSSIDPSKVLVLKGTSVFGGIEIRSY
jgi:predicted membrane protein